MAFEESFITVDGCRTRIRRGGKGPTVLYLHGANGAPMIQPFMEVLAQDYDLIVPEHPGFGMSDEPEWLDNMQDLAYFYLDLLDQLELESVHIVGSSMGGWLAMEMGIREPRRIKSLTLVGTAGVRVPGILPGDIFLWDAETAASNTFFNQDIAQKVLSMAPDTEEAQDIMLKNRETVARLAWQPRLYDLNLPKWLHRIQAPVKLIWGEQDKIMPLAVGEALQPQLPNATLQVFKNCGHLPQVEFPDEFSASVKQFIEGVK
ncbi:alpha/beta fold hydrolase [Neopusillimonas maritima]|uniref:Alpha/beta hydrolase n=1 Tax=Neopusillimonas maritima TaxID=2026239 RepID=A0A3A1YWB3_9BURK|nr:alpha/beta hydrolase [Neopusillimonas maritima]RIY42492.1 alpha/beta hydrolase [Neopusillimonas maritima]